MANNVNNGTTGVIDIPGALRSRGAADGNLVGGVVAYAGDIYDVTAGKNQATLNAEFAEGITNASSSSFSGNYNDLSNIPLLKTENNGFKVNAHGRRKNTASEQDSFAEGAGTTASGQGSHSEGGGTIASGTCSHAEGNNVNAVGNSSHAEGSFTTAIGSNSHAEGNNAHAYGNNTHAEGLQETLLPLTTRAYTATSSTLYINTEIFPGCIIYDTDDTPRKVLSCEYQEAGDDYKVAFQGINEDLKIGDEVYVDFCAFGDNSHTEGYDTHAYGESSHAEGVHTITTNKAEHASGMYNISTANKTLFSVGAGHDGSRMNAFEIDTSSNVYIYGVGGYDGTNSTTTGIKSVLGVISDIESNSSSSSSSYTHPSTHPASMITYDASTEYESGNIGYEIKRHATDLSTRLGGIKSTGNAENNSGAAISTSANALAYIGRQRMYDVANHEYINVIYENAGTVSVGEETCAIGKFSFAAGQGNNGGGNAPNYYYHVASTYEAGDKYIYLQEEPVGQYLSFKEDPYDKPSGDHLAKIVSKTYSNDVWEVQLAEPYINRNINANDWVYPITGSHGQNSSSFGMLTVAQGEGSTVVGKYNYPMSNELFSVGCGTGLPASARKNALIVLDNGSIYIKGVGNYDGTSIADLDSLLTVITDVNTRLSDLEGIVLTGDNIVIATSPHSEFYSTDKGAEGNVIIGNAIIEHTLLVDEGSFKRNIIVGNSNKLNNCDRTAISGSIIFGNNNDVTGGVCIGVNNTNQSTSDARRPFTLLGTRLTAGDSNDITYNYNFIPNATVIGVNNNPTTFNGIYSIYRNGDWTDAGAFEVGAGKNNTGVSILAQKSDGNLYIKGVGGWDGMSSVKDKKSINTIISEFETRIAALESQIAALTNNL